MCVPTHAVLVIRKRGRSPRGVWRKKRRTPVEGRGTPWGGWKEREKKKRREDDRTYVIRDRHKAADPWEYRACASGQLARGLHELHGVVTLSPPAVTALPIHAASLRVHARASHSVDPRISSSPRDQVGATGVTGVHLAPSSLRPFRGGEVEASRAAARGDHPYRVIK